MTTVQKLGGTKGLFTSECETHVLCAFPHRISNALVVRSAAGVNSFLKTQQMQITNAMHYI